MSSLRFFLILLALLLCKVPSCSHTVGDYLQARVRSQPDAIERNAPAGVRKLCSSDRFLICEPPRHAAFIIRSCWRTGGLLFVRYTVRHLHGRAVLIDWLDPLAKQCQRDRCDGAADCDLRNTCCHEQMYQTSTHYHSIVCANSPRATCPSATPANQRSRSTS